MTHIETLKLALEALENCVATCFDQYAHHQVMSRPEHFVNQAITALRQAIEQAEQYNATSDRVLMENAQGDLERVTLVRTGVGIGQAEQAQPVGEVLNERGEVDWISFVPSAGTHLYTAPPPRKPLSLAELFLNTPPRQPWVGLTDEEIDYLCQLAYTGDEEFIKTIEAKLKEKNNV